MADFAWTPPGSAMAFPASQVNTGSPQNNPLQMLLQIAELRALRNRGAFLGNGGGAPSGYGGGY